jgi:hypothetical protein
MTVTNAKPEYPFRDAHVSGMKLLRMPFVENFIAKMKREGSTGDVEVTFCLLLPETRQTNS